jgi:hypothetical protein
MSNRVRPREFQRGSGKLTRPRDEWKGKARQTTRVASGDLSAAMNAGFDRQLAKNLLAGFGKGGFASVIKSFVKPRTTGRGD